MWKIIRQSSSQAVNYLWVSAINFNQEFSNNNNKGIIIKSDINFKSLLTH